MSFGSALRVTEIANLKVKDVIDGQYDKCADIGNPKIEKALEAISLTQRRKQ